MADVNLSDGNDGWRLVSTFILLPGAGGSAWYWSRVVPLLERAGHSAVAVDLPGDDDTAGLPEYTRIAVEAIGDRSDVVVVAQSLGGFTAPMVCAAATVSSLIFVNAMIPLPGETPGDWWGNTGAITARDAAAEAGGYGDFDVATYFLHDVPQDVAVEGAAYERPEADAVFVTRCDFASWPSIPIRVLCGADDRFFPVAFQCDVARDRLGITADVRPGGHLIALAHPESVADYLLQQP
jgi:pimeloyl-ACP methyl ester carboxylesterase